MKKLFLLDLVGLFLISPGFPNLQAQYLPASSNAIFRFAHLADGGPQTDKWKTVFRIINPNAITNLTVSGTLWFFDPQGNPLALDFGNGAVTSLPISLAVHGAIELKTTGASQVLRTGSVVGQFDSPVLAVEEFQNWRNGVLVNGASINASGGTYEFQTFADKYTGIAVVNPTSGSISCSGTFLDGVGNSLGSNSVTVPGFGQTSFTLGNILSIPTGAPGSYFLKCQNAPFAALAIAGDSHGITSSMPPGDYALPSNQYRTVWNAFYQLVKALNSVPGLQVGQPKLQILGDQALDAKYYKATNTVMIQLALVELLADSPSEVASVIAHELGHAHQALAGSQFNATDPELDADQFSLWGLLFAGYDAYAAGGAMGKLLMVSGRTPLLVQLYDDLADPHTSFTNRMGLIMGEIQYVCSLPEGVPLCQQVHGTFHPHLPSSSAPLLKKTASE